MPHAPLLRALVVASTLATWMLPVEALAQPAKPADAPTEDPEAKKATAFFLKGADFFKRGRHALALEQFKQSYAVVPSPNSRFFIARCLAALGEHSEAYREYSKVIAEVAARGAEGEKYAETAKNARIEREDLAPKVALVTIKAPASKLDLSVRVAGEPIAQERWGTAFPVKPGLVLVDIQIGNQPAASESLTLAAGEKRIVVLDDAPAVQASNARAAEAAKPGDTGSGGSVLRPLAYAAGGVGVVGMVMFAVSGSMSRSTYSSLESQCGAGPCPSGLADEISKGKSQQTIANVGLIVGAVGLASGATMFILSMKGGKSDAAPKKPGASLELGPGYVGVAGQF